MKINKFLPLLFGVLLISCQPTNQQDEGRPEKSIVDKILDRAILEKEEMGLIGEVHSVLEYEFESKFWVDRTRKLKEGAYPTIIVDASIQEIRDVPIRMRDSYLFNKAGQVTKHIRVFNHKDTQIDELKEYIFDNRDRVIEIRKSNPPKNLSEKSNFSYDNKNRLIEADKLNLSDSSILKVIVSYIQDTIELKNISIENGGSPVNGEENKYNKYGEIIDDYEDPEDPNVQEEFDDKGNLVKFKYKSTDKVISSFSISCDYDSKNNKVRKAEYDSENNLIKTEMFYYNEKNILMESIEIDSLTTVIKRYGKDGIYVSEYNSSSISPEGNYYSGSWKNFDKYGNIIKIVNYHTNEDGKLTEQIRRMELEYDKIGNWISKKVFENDSMTVIAERKINYY